MEKEFTAFKKVLKFNEVSKIEFKSYDELKEDVKKEVGFELPDYELLKWIDLLEIYNSKNNNIILLIY